MTNNAEKFRDACIDTNTVSELEQDWQPGNRADLEEWGITREEWDWAVSEALRIRREWASEGQS